jgi:hypothetical protein
MKLLYRTRDYAFIISAMGNCLQQPGQLRNQLYKSMLATSIHLLNWYTVTHPAAETKSIGLQADAQLAAFFALRL